MSTPKAVRKLVTAGRLEVVPADLPTARAHEAVGDYAEASIDSPSTAQFHAPRRRRNKAEYDDIVLSRADFEADLVHAEAIIDAVRDTVGTK